MLRDERLDKIEEYVNMNRYVPLTELMTRFGISRATCRRDLEALAENRRVTVTRGGASAVSRGTIYELPYQEKRKLNYEEKSRIAKAACAHIKAGETIMIDSGTTGALMAEYFPDLPDIYAATNDLMTAIALLSCPHINLIFIGGSIRKGFYTACGYFAAEEISNYHFDKVFLCMDAINAAYGCMITNAEEVEVKHSIMNAGREVIALCDHTKFNSSAFISICPTDRLDRVITGQELPEDIRAQFADRGVEMQLV
jgi:DeoR/GlpR family transcriptional regulator of sugar metabolism